MPSSLHRHDPTDCLADIVENAERIEGYLAGMDRANFQADGRTRDAVERCVERVCEAVVRLGDRAEALMPGHPWSDIRGTGNQPATLAECRRSAVGVAGTIAARRRLRRRRA